MVQLPCSYAPIFCVTSPPTVSAQTQGGRTGPGPHRERSYGQLAETIFRLLTFTDGRLAPAVVPVPAVVAPAVVPPAVDPAVPAVEPAVPAVDAVMLRFIELSHVVFPEICTLWPTCLSRSVPPSSVQLIGVAAIIPRGALPAVAPVVAPAVVPPDVVPPVVAAVVAPPVVPAVVALIGSTVALVNMNRPSAAFATHPVTVTSRAAALALAVCGGVAVAVEPCAPSEIDTEQMLATQSPVILCVIRWPPLCRIHASLCTRYASDAWTG